MKFLSFVFVVLLIVLSSVSCNVHVSVDVDVSSESSEFIEIPAFSYFHPVSETDLDDATTPTTPTPPTHSQHTIKVPNNCGSNNVGSSVRNVHIQAPVGVKLTPSFHPCHSNYKVTPQGPLNHHPLNLSLDNIDPI